MKNMDSGGNKIYIVGNWKMNPVSPEDAEALFDEIENDVYKIDDCGIEIVICMPYMFLPEFDSEGRIALGAQNVFWESRGAFTGEISAGMLRRAGAKYAIVGHSERRTYLLENDEMANMKIRACLAGMLRPILCVGETAEQRERGDAGEVVAGQVEKALEGISDPELSSKLIIAYEPVWAVGSNVTPVPDEVMSTKLVIRKTLMKIYGDREIIERIPILYGGSVCVQNCFDFVDKTGMNGLLVGRASLSPREFAGIIGEFARRKQP